MYKYLSIEQARVGDVVEAVKTIDKVTKGSLYTILPSSTNSSIGHYINDEGEHTNGINLSSEYWKLIATKPGSEAKIGDTVVCVKDTRGDCKINNSFIVAVLSDIGLGPVKGTKFGNTHSKAGWGWLKADFLVLCKADELEQQPTTRHTIGDNCEWEDKLLMTGTSTSCYLTATYAIQTNQSQKENTMNELQQLLSTIFGAEKPTTDYDKRPQLLVVVYSLDGKKVATATADSVDQVADEVKRNPSLWGCKVLTYKLNKELFVDVPVSITKAKIATASDEE